MFVEKYQFNRLELLVGPKCLSALTNTRVAVFGAGGVGSWCAEALTRSGIGKLTVVDSDDVCVTNINRQLQAMPASIGKPKADEIVRRLREINPAADITGVRRVYNRDTKEMFGLDGYDYVIDAIDSLSSKVDLIMNASASGATVFSALGAACKVNPAKIRVSSIWKSDKCRLGKFVRKRLRRQGFKGDFLCVWSDEPKFCAYSDGVNGIYDDNIDIYDMDTDNIDANARPTNKTINGSIVHVTGIFGFTLSGLVIQDIINRVNRDATN